MGLATLFRKLSDEHGIAIDDEELAGLGLSDEDEPADEPEVAVTDDILSQDLPGTAAGAIELFLSDDLSTAAKEPKVDGDGLMWYPIIREGQWAVRPGQNGKKKRTPLRVIAGSSKNQRREIGLQDLKDAFDDEAIQHVTVPSSHNNTVLENQGFIKGVKIVDGTVKNKITKKDQAVKVLMGGYDITEPDTKGKMARGTIANRSAGILYDYVNTETGKTYPAVIEHVALTNKPWITGMISFGRKLASTTDLETVALSLSDEGPTDDEYVMVLSEESRLSEDEGDFLAQDGGDWSKEGSPNWLRQQVNSLLEDARAKKLRAKRVAANGQALSYVEDYPPHYRCVEAIPGRALISDGYSDDSNFWAAPITIKDGAVELDEFTKWTKLKEAYVTDDRPDPPKDKLPLSGDQEGASAPPAKSRIQLAQEARKLRGRPGQTDVPDNNDPPRGGGNMAGENGTLELSEEAQRAIQAAEARAQAAEERATQLSERVERLTGSVNRGEVDSYIEELKSANFDEAHGFGGVLVEIRELMLADDGEPAVQSEHFSTDGNAEGELTLSEALKRVFGAFKRTEEGKLALGEALGEPADPEAGEAGKDGEKKEPGTKAGETETAAGKPAAEDTPAEKLSTDEKVGKIVETSPELARVLGRPTTTPAGGDA